MKKIKLIAMVMTLALVFSTMFSVSFADSTNVDIEKAKIMKELKKLESKYDVVFTEDVAESLEGIITLNSVEEVEKLLKELTKGDNPVILSSSQQTTKEIQAYIDVYPIYESSNTITWWTPFAGFGMTGAACWKNISFDYEYYYHPTYGLMFPDNAISNITSDITGLTWVDWVQMSASAPTIDGLTGTNFTIKGYYLLGININGYTLGARINETWNKYYSLE